MVRAWALHFNLVTHKEYTMGKLSEEQESATTLSEIAPKWRQLPHVKAALKGHLRDMGAALESGDGNLRIKEATDLVLVLQSLLGLQATAAQAAEIRRVRIQKFKTTGKLPPLA